MLPERFIRQVEGFFCHGGEHPPGRLRLPGGFDIVVKCVKEHIGTAQFLQSCQVAAHLLQRTLANYPLIVGQWGVGQA